MNFYSSRFFVAILLRDFSKIVRISFRTAATIQALELVYHFPNSLNVGKNIGLETLLATTPLYANMLIALVAFMAQDLVID